MQEYIKLLNKSMPEIGEIKLNFKNKAGINLTDDKAEKYRNRMLFCYEKKHESGNIIQDFIKNTNVSFVGIGTLTFYDDLIEIEAGIYQFADYEDDELKLCITDDNEVIGLESDNQYKITSSFDYFMKFVLLYHKVYINKVYRQRGISEKEKREIFDLVANGFSNDFTNCLLQQLV